MTNAMTSHSDAELLAAFVDGKLDPQQIQAVTAHLASCEECRGVIGEAVAFQREEEPQVRSRTMWWAGAAAVGGAGVAYPRFRLFPQPGVINNGPSPLALRA